jgi:hypothetical protein
LAKSKSDKGAKLQNKLNKQMAKANKTRGKLEKARSSGSARADGSLSYTTSSQ